MGCVMSSSTPSRTKGAIGAWVVGAHAARAMSADVWAATSSGGSCAPLGLFGGQQCLTASMPCPPRRARRSGSTAGASP